MKEGKKRGAREGTRRGRKTKTSRGQREPIQHMAIMAESCRDQKLGEGSKLRGWRDLG